jgi:outer membrane receptor protein involved in Fe transport
MVPGIKFHTSIGTAFSVPDAFKVAGFYSVSEYFAAWDYWWVNNYVGNPDLKPEVSLTVDGGIKYSSPNKLLTIDATYFRTNHDNKIIEYNLTGDTTSYKNASQSRMSGLEFMFTSNLGVLFDDRFKLELYANLTQMLKSEVDETLIGASGQDSTVVRHMLYTRRNNGNFGILFDSFRGFSTRLHVRHIGPRLELDNFSLLRPGITPGDYYTRGGYTESDKILELPQHLVADFSIFYTVRGNTRFGITISNLFDENYSEKDGYHMPGRMVTGSFSYSF